MRSKVLSGTVLAGVAVVLLVFAAPSYRQGEPSQAGRVAPEFSFVRDGKPGRLADLRGRVVVLNFWATWCPPCVDEMPSLNRLHTQLAATNGLVLGVSVDQSAADYEKFLRDYGIRFPNHRDPAQQVASAYGSTMYPETYIIGPDGKIARKIIGPQNWDAPEWLAYLRTLK